MSRPGFHGDRQTQDGSVGYNGLEEGWFGWPYSKPYNSSSPQLCGGYNGPTPGDIHYGTC